MPEEPPNTSQENVVRLDPAVDAAKRTIVALQKIELPQGLNDDIVTMAVCLLRLAGYRINDQTGEGHPNATPATIKPAND